MVQRRPNFRRSVWPRDPLLLCVSFLRVVSPLRTLPIVIRGSSVLWGSSLQLVCWLVPLQQLEAIGIDVGNYVLDYNIRSPGSRSPWDENRWNASQPWRRRVSCWTGPASRLTPCGSASHASHPSPLLAYPSESYKHDGTAADSSLLSSPCRTRAGRIAAAHRNRSFDINGENCIYLGTLSRNPTCARLVDSAIQGAYGPLRPPNKAKIPLWIAVNLKLKKKCHIIAPSWLNVGVSPFCICRSPSNALVKNFYKND